MIRRIALPVVIASAVLLAGCSSSDRSASSVTEAPASAQVADAAEATGTVDTITDDTFDAKVRNASGPYVLYFTAPWCAPCKQMAPNVWEAASQLKDYNVTFGQMDVDQSPITPSKYRVNGVPTTVIFRDGQEVARKSGALPLRKYMEWLSNNV